MENSSQLYLPELDQREFQIKNLLKIKNKPLIYYSINASVKSKYISKTILYSDSTKILKVGKKFAAITDYLRPKNISKDNTTMYQTLSYFFKKQQSI